MAVQKSHIQSLDSNKNTPLPACSTPEEALQLGITLGQQGHYSESLAIFERAIDKFGMRVDLLFNRGITYQKLNRHIDALNTFLQIQHHISDFAPIYYTIGISQFELGMYQESIESFNKAIDLQNIYPEAWNSKGVSQQNLQLWDDAVISHTNAIDQLPEFADAYNSLGNALIGLGKYRDSLECFNKALTIQVDHIDALNNSGIAYHRLNMLNEAINQFNKAIDLANIERDTTIRFNRSLAYLLNGDLEQGWQDYEYRTILNEHKQLELPWNGTDFLDTIYLKSEQGFGDTIQFIRYAPIVRNYCRRLILECQSGLKSLLQNIPEIDDIVERDENNEISQAVENAHIIYLLSLPAIFKTSIDTIPSQVPYLKTPDVRLSSWKMRTNQMFKMNSAIRVGIVWSGAKDYKEDKFRSLQLSEFNKLTKIDNVSLYSLQKGEHTPELSTMGITDLTLGITDFADTAAVIDLLDLIITVDTATAHLAGALGKAAWVLLPYSPDWRWMLNREDSPWYPSIRLFRQESAGDWTGVFTRLAQSLNEFVQIKFEQNNSTNETEFNTTMLEHAA